MSTPAVSIVIPTFNRPELIARAIRSVLAQTFTDYEIVVVDDGDKIRAGEVVESFHEPRIRYIKNDPPKRGGGASRNVGINESEGKYVAFLDDDDEWLPTKLEKQIDMLLSASEDVGFCATGVLNKSECGEFVNSPTGKGVTDFFETTLTRFAGFLTSALVIKAEVFRVVGAFDESLPSHQEAELMIRVSQRYKGIALPEPLVHMDVSEHEHVGGNLGRCIEGRMKLLNKHADLYKSRPKVLAKHYFQLGLWYRDSGDIKKARTNFFRAFLHSFNLRHLAHGVSSLV